MTAPYTAAELAAILARAEAATPGPWSTERPGKDQDGWLQGVIVAAVARGQGIYATPPGGSFPEADRRFIAAARNDVPRLVAELTRAREALRLALPWVCAYVSDPPADDEVQAALDSVVAALGEEPADGDTER